MFALITSALALLAAGYCALSVFWIKRAHAKNLEELKAKIDVTLEAQAWVDSYRAQLDGIIHNYHQAIARHN